MEGVQDITKKKTGQLLKKVLVSGSGPLPRYGNLVRCHYTGTLLASGKGFDCSRARGEPLEFMLGKGVVIKGWDMGVATMQVGERSQLTISSKYGYGPSGMVPKIPPNADLVFDIALLSFREEDLSERQDGSILRTVLKKGTETNVKPELGCWVDVVMEGRCWNLSQEPKQNNGESMGTCDSKLEETSDTKSEKTSDAKIEETSDAKLEKINDTKLEETSDTKLEQTSDTKLDKTSDCVDAQQSCIDGVEPKDSTEQENMESEDCGPNAGKNKKLFDERSIKFVLGQAESENVPGGLETAIKHFQRGEKSRITLLPHQGFGDTGCAALGVGPGSVLEYTIHVQDYEEEVQAWQLGQEERLAHARKHKEKGTEYFKGQRFSLALHQYQKTRNFAQISSGLESDAQTEMHELWLTSTLNSALCHLKLGEHNKAKHAATEVLEKDGENVKAHFRRGSALQNLCDYEAAISDFDKVLSLDAGNGAAERGRRECIAAQQKAAKAMQNTYKGMFDKFAASDAVAPPKARRKVEKVGDWGAELGNVEIL